MFWGWIWGPVGALISVPVTIMAKIMLEHTEDLRWIAVLLGPSDGPRARAVAAERGARDTPGRTAER